MVAPGTAAWAAARTLSAVSPVSSASFTPFWPTWPPWAGSNWPPGAPPLGAGAVVLEPLDVWAPALPSRLAPMAPPVTAVATSAAPAAALRIEIMWLPFSLVCVSPSGSGRRRGSGSAVSPRSGLPWNPLRFGDEGSAHPTELDAVLVGSALLGLRQPFEDA